MTPKYRVVFFDFDSTLVSVEGVDILADGDPRVVALTQAAMSGEIALDEVYGKRLDIIRPTAKKVEDLARTYRDAVLPDAKSTIAALIDAGCVLHVVSAGVEQAVKPVAIDLGFAPERIFSVRLRFDDAGEYAGFDPSPLTRSGGKELVVMNARARLHGKAVMIGDGMTDLETIDAVDLFVGFGGVTIRNEVRDLAPLYLVEPRLAPLIPIIVGGEG